MHAEAPPVRRPSGRPRRLAVAVAAALAGLGLGGCEVASFLDPTVVTDPKKRNQLQEDGSANPIVSVILDDLALGVTPPDEPFADARDVRAGDLEVVTEDYIIGPGDQLRITISNYPNIGQQFVDAFEVSSTGFVNLPDVREVTVENLTETEAARAIERRYVEEQILNAGSAKVNVLAFTKQNRTFTIIGNAVNRGNRYVITQPDFRLLDAMALAGAVVDPSLLSEYVYVIRRTDRATSGGPAGNDNGGGNQNNQGGQVRPGGNDPLSPRGDASDEAAPESESVDAWDAVFAQAQGGNRGGNGGESFAFDPPTEPANSEVIRVPVVELLNGQLKFNVVVRAGDTILMSGEPIGVYYIGGNAAVGGVYNLSPQNPVTLKRAIISARGFTPVAIPQRTQLIRTFGDQEVFVRVDLKKIFAGAAPDLYLKPNDQIMVGTNFPAPFLAALRNGFRVSYGFGFLYDRNFARDRNDNGF